MATKVDPISDASLEGVCRIVGDAYTGSEIDGLVRSAGLPTSEVSTKWRRLFDILSREQFRTGAGNCVVALLRQAFDPRRFTANPQLFEELRGTVNGYLAFEGLLLREDGKFQRISVAQTLSEAANTARRLHDEMVRRGGHAEIFKYCTKELIAQDCFSAVFEAVKGLASRVRDMAGVDFDGAELVDTVFGISRPIIAFNSLRTSTERNEQNGLASLMRGAFSAFRNPAAHEPKIEWHVSEPDALDLLTMLCLIHRRLDASVVIPADANY